MQQQHEYDTSKMKSSTDKREEREKQRNARYATRLGQQRMSGMNFAFYRCHPDQTCKDANKHADNHRNKPEQVSHDA